MKLEVLSEKRKQKVLAHFSFFGNLVKNNKKNLL